MKVHKLYSSILLIPVFALILQSRGGACSCGLSAEDRAFLEGNADKEEAHFNSGDRSKYTEKFADDAVFLIPNGDMLQGKQAITSWVNGFPPLRLDLEEKDTRGSCDFAAVRGTFTLSQENGTLVDKGKWIQVWEKSDDGTWQITMDTFNSDLPLPEVEQDEEGS